MCTLRADIVLDTLECLTADTVLTAGTTVGVRSIGRSARAIGALQRMARAGARIAVDGGNPDAGTESVIAASLGVECAVALRPDTMLADSLADSVTYQFYGRCAHAPIEPWASMASLYGDGIPAWPGEPAGIPAPSPRRWQEMIVDCHPCSFCPSFRLCQGYFAPQADKGDCRRLLEQVREAAEFLTVSAEQP